MPGGTEEQHRHFLELQQATASAENAEKFRDIFGVIAVTALAARVTVPTLVMHAREDLVVPVDQARLLASTIPNAEYVLIEGKNHILMEHEPGWQRFLAEVDRFVGRAPKMTCGRQAAHEAPTCRRYDQ
jgi:pimeloyl-ACP methyl ester carboxylesterase